MEERVFQILKEYDPLALPGIEDRTEAERNDIRTAWEGLLRHFDVSLEEYVDELTCRGEWWR